MCHCSLGDVEMEDENEEKIPFNRTLYFPVHSGGEATNNGIKLLQSINVTIQVLLHATE